jgi:hypothetical protein
MKGLSLIFLKGPAKNKTHGMGDPKLQTSIEYLMTYLWALIIVVVVLLIIFWIGILNSTNSTPTAKPGACQVIKSAYGGVALSGECSNFPPEFVAQFNGVASYVNAGAGDNSGLDIVNSLTIGLWVNAGQNTAQEYLYSKATGSNTGKYFMCGGTPTSTTVVFSCEIESGGGASEAVAATSTLNLGQWYYVAYTYDGTYGRTYTNGVLTSLSASYVRSAPYPSDTGVPLYFGQRSSGGYFNGNLSNVQIYSTALSANSITFLYAEGMGGDPIPSQYLIGWWPLNGNANDYSGNGNNGQAYYVTYPP